MQSVLFGESWSKAAIACVKSCLRASLWVDAIISAVRRLTLPTRMSDSSSMSSRCSRGSNERVLIWRSESGRAPGNTRIPLAWTCLSFSRLSYPPGFKMWRMVVDPNLDSPDEWWNVPKVGRRDKKSMSEQDRMTYWNAEFEGTQGEVPGLDSRPVAWIGTFWSSLVVGSVRCPTGTGFTAMMFHSLQSSSPCAEVRSRSVEDQNNIINNLYSLECRR